MTRENIDMADFKGPPLSLLLREQAPMDSYVHDLGLVGHIYGYGRS